MKAVLALPAALLLCASARAQTADPGATAPPPAASTDTAVSSGTASSPPPVDLSSTTAGGAVPAAARPKPAPPANPIRVKIHKEAASWEPYSVKAGGDPAAARGRFAWRQVKRGKGYSGPSSKAKAVARLYKAGEDARLVISVFPDKLAERRTHIELRFLIIEGYLEKVAVAAVIADPGAGPLDDATQLEAKGIGFQEEFPASGAITLAAVDARPSKAALNAGSLSRATFARSELNPNSLGLVSVEFSAKGVVDARKR
jgi:hypothetical protein